KPRAARASPSLFSPLFFFALISPLFPSAPDPEVILKPPTKKGTPSSCSRKKRAAFSPGQEPSSLRLSPAAASPQGRRRSWRRSSLKGRRSLRRSLPPVHREVTELSQSISLELPEVQRLSLLLLSSFQFCARKLQQDLEGSEGFDPEVFSAKVQKGSEEFQRLLQRLLQDGTLGNCLEPTPGDCLDPALEGSVAQVKLLMASLSGELQAWDRLLQQHLQRSQEASRSLQQLRSGPAPFAPPPPLRPSPLAAPRPDYGSVLAQQRPALRQLRLLVDEAQQAGKMLLEFHQQSRSFLRDLSEQLASRTFQKLPGSPARRLLQRRPQKSRPEEGE
ncbi:kinetochore-associated protein DSN1 homolog, partial [Camarhynchus parvulus]|uniref:kinetochore-associated protein DSN1 homolog n=1 Tax=Geospiza parvula TaxID=87175 RepID=UPI001237C565